MHKIIKKIISLILTAAVFAGCSADTSSAPGSTRGSAVSEASKDESSGTHAAVQPYTKPPERSNTQPLGSEKDPYFSGPIVTPLESESYAIINAPEYDVDQAKSYIGGMEDIRNIIDGVEDSGGVTAFGERSPSKEALENLEKEIDVLCSEGHKVTLMMIDLKSKSGVAYRPFDPMCAQSTAKAIFAGSLLENDPGALEDNGQYLHDAIVFSSNYSYSMLYEIYGTDYVRQWCAETGASEYYADIDYPLDMTAADMTKLWTRLYCFLNGDGEASDFARYFADTSASATRKQLSGRYPVQTKAGWECGLAENENYDPNAEPLEFFTDGSPFNGECAINDTGVVYTEESPYIFAIFSD